MTERQGYQIKIHSLTIEDLVPENHLLRKVERIVKWDFIYEAVRELYSETVGRSSIDPVMLVKYLLVGFLYGIGSERRIEQEIEVNMAYRWFLGLDIGERVPDHSTISQNRKRRFNGTGLFRQIFEEIVGQCMKEGLVEGQVILTDSTHVKANGSRRRNMKVEVEWETTDYMRRLDAAEAEERQRLEQAGKIKPQRKSRASKGTERREKMICATDPDAGMLNRPGKPKGPHYLSHQSIDPSHGIIVDTAVTSGSANDSTPYLGRIEYIRSHFGLPIQTAGADSAYGTTLIFKSLEDMNIQLYTPGTPGGTTYQVELTRDDFLYDEKADQFICPQGKRLPLRSLERTEHNICRVYRAERTDCQACPLYSQCVASSHYSRTLRVNIFEAAAKRQQSGGRHSERRHILNLRQIWCEGAFAAQKARHNLRQLFRRGIEAAEDHCLLSATAFNLKRMVRCLG